MQRGLFFFQIGLLFSNFLKGNSVSKSVLSKSHAKKLQPFDEKLSVMEEGYTVAFQADNKSFSSNATFESEMMAESYLQEQVRNNPSLKKQLHILPNYELQEV